MKFSQRFWRGLVFLLLVAALCGGIVLPMLGQASAAPLMQATACAGTTITQWTFTGITTPSTGSGTLSVSGLSGPTPAADASGTANQAVSFSGWSTSSTLNPTSYIQFAVSTIGRNGISLSFDYRSTAAGPANLELHYSIDGTNFVLFSTPTALTRDAQFHSLSFDLSTITALDNNPNVIFGLYGYSAGGGNLRLDNVTISGCLTPAELTGTAVVNSTNTAVAANQTGTALSNQTGTAASNQTGTAVVNQTGSAMPTASPIGLRSVIISEVAWMGTGASGNDEWIELYNPGSLDIDLSNWRIVATDGIPSITIPSGKVIPAGGFFLLETSDNAVIDAVADHVYGSSNLTDTGESLQLLSPLSVTPVDTANSNGGSWPAGNSTFDNSMERVVRGGVPTPDSDTAWISNVQSSTWTKHDSRGTTSTNFLIRGTPGYGNWAFTVTPTVAPTRSPTPRPSPTRTLTPPPPPPLVAINEFVPRPGHDWNNDGLVNVEDEYVELINHGTIDVNLGGYSLDDEVNIGSRPYSLPSITISPGERIVFYGSETGLLLSDGGDGVRLLMPNGQLGDAYNYRVVRFPDQAFCRLPDNGGADDWNTNCFPTPGLQNALGGSSASPPNLPNAESQCPIADTLPIDFILAECPPFGNNIWRSSYWDETGWYNEKYLPESPGKWPVFAD